MPEESEPADRRGGVRLVLVHQPRRAQVQLAHHVDGAVVRLPGQSTLTESIHQPNVSLNEWINCETKRQCRRLDNHTVAFLSN